MPWVGFEPTVPASARAKIVHVLDRSVTVAGEAMIRLHNFTCKETLKNSVEIWYLFECHVSIIFISIYFFQLEELLQFSINQNIYCLRLCYSCRPMYILTDLALSRKSLGKHVPTNAHPRYSNTLVNIYHSNDIAKMGHPLLGNACVDTPDKIHDIRCWATDVFSMGGPCQAYIRSSSVRVRIPPPWILRAVGSDEKGSLKS
jgi:hypothetical protein